MQSLEVRRGLSQELEAGGMEEDTESDAVLDQAQAANGLPVQDHAWAVGLD